MKSPIFLGLSAFFLGLFGATLLLIWLNNSTITPDYLIPMGMMTVVASVGLLIISRQSHNSIGWILICTALGTSLYLFSYQFARYGLLKEPGSVPLGLFFAWVSSWIWVLYAIPVVTYLPLLFPTGRLPSYRWKGVAWLTGGYLVFVALSEALRPRPLAGFESFRNPFGLESASNSFKFIELFASSLLVALALASVSSLVIRFARSRGDERAQLKWFFYVAALFIAYVIYGIISFISFLPDPPEGLGTYVFPLFLAMFAVAIAIAIFKYRLYDIDVIIRKTLVYAALTLLLALIYFGGVTLVGNLFSSISGQQSTIAVVISTLTIAALFNPLRKRVQEFIDRRFYRKRYDIEKIIEAFSTSLRDQVEIEQLTSRLTEVIEEALQPVQLSIWLRPIKKNKYKYQASTFQEQGSPE
jgi:hypothetical protein